MVRFRGSTEAVAAGGNSPRELGGPSASEAAREAASCQESEDRPAGATRRSGRRGSALTSINRNMSFGRL